MLGRSRVGIRPRPVSGSTPARPRPGSRWHRPDTPGVRSQRASRSGRAPRCPAWSSTFSASTASGWSGRSFDRRSGRSCSSRSCRESDATPCPGAGDDEGRPMDAPPINSHPRRYNTPSSSTLPPAPSRTDPRSCTSPRPCCIVRHLLLAVGGSLRLRGVIASLGLVIRRLRDARAEGAFPSPYCAVRSGTGQDPRGRTG